ncbi:MAG TPA: ubiquinol-cytochrome C chaperone family protein [Sphingomicrobium sp.]|nr:ubiquinol-cytochrome C chaperone family protein [Sphingomicrobium sp.]
MLRFLFPGLTSDSKRGQTLFDRAVAQARRPFWYAEAQVPDTIDGRFAMLATICALVIVRLESGSAKGEAASAALTERFIEAMDSEHRELGLNDPGLGRKVRKLVGALERRVDLWRQAAAGRSEWAGAVHESIYRGREAEEPALERGARGLQEFWQRLSLLSEDDLVHGRF